MRQPGSERLGQCLSQGLWTPVLKVGVDEAAEDEAHPLAGRAVVTGSTPARNASPMVACFRRPTNAVMGLGARIQI